MTGTNWSSRSVGSSIDDIIDVSTLTFDVPVFINPPAKLQQQKLIHTIVNKLYSLDDTELDAFEDNLPFDNTTLTYTIVTHEDQKSRFENNKLYLLNSDGTNTDSNGSLLNWQDELLPFGVIREGISQLRLRKSTDPSDKENDVIGRITLDNNNVNALNIEVDEDTLPTNTLGMINAVIDPLKNFPGDGHVPVAAVGQRYLLLNDIPSNQYWTSSTAIKHDIVEFNGSTWTTSFNSSANSAISYVTNAATSDQYKWTDGSWINSVEGIYNPGYWRMYL
jgi:hypothetical protein